MNGDNKIVIPWYRRNVPRPLTLDDEKPFGGFDFPDMDKRRRRRRPSPNPTPDPTPQPDGIRVGVRQRSPDPVIITVNGKQYLDDGVFLTPVIDVKQPDKLPNTNPNKKPHGGKIPELPFPKLPGLPGLSPKPALGMGVPGDEILLKLMEADPSYSKFVKKYNDFTMQLIWEMQNPFIIYDYPSYSQVKKLMKTFDISKMNSKDVKAYFKDLGVKGKDLNTAATRFFIYYETLKVGQQIEDIFVPPIKNVNPMKHS